VDEVEECLMFEHICLVWTWWYEANGNGSRWKGNC